jgi:hypothetical protein
VSARLTWALVALVSVVALGATAIFGVVAWQQYQQRQAAPSSVETTTSGGSGDRVMFRNTASGAGYGHVASVPLSRPDGERTVTDLVCDRIDTTGDDLACLRTERGIVPSYSATVYDRDGKPIEQWPLPGIPSRTRVSGDGSLIATTSFVTGHSYATLGFSTETVIHTRDGESLGNLEDWTLVVNGQPSMALDRNFWGVTFVDDSSFYATVGLNTLGQTYLVVGDIAARSLTTVAENVECPSLSPDGTRIAFKRVTAGGGSTAHWTPAIYDLSSGDITLLPEDRSIDDQIEWLDDDTILYGMPRTDAVGDTDVWQLDVDGSAAPTMFIEHAWSPSVVRSRA